MSYQHLDSFWDEWRDLLRCAFWPYKGECDCPSCQHKREGVDAVIVKLEEAKCEQ